MRRSLISLLAIVLLAVLAMGGGPAFACDECDVPETPTVEMSTIWQPELQIRPEEYKAIRAQHVAAADLALLRREEVWADEPHHMHACE